MNPLAGKVCCELVFPDLFSPSGVVASSALVFLSFSPLTPIFFLFSFSPHYWSQYFENQEATELLPFGRGQRRVCRGGSGGGLLLHAACSASVRWPLALAPTPALPAPFVNDLRPPEGVPSSFWRLSLLKILTSLREQNFQTPKLEIPRRSKDRALTSAGAR